MINKHITMDENIELESPTKNREFLKGLLFFSLPASLFAIAGYVNGTYVTSHNDYYYILLPQLTEEQLEAIRQSSSLKLSCIAPIFTQFFYTLVVSLVVFIGYYLTIKQKFSIIFKCAALSQTVFAVMYIVYYSVLGFGGLPECAAGLSTYPLSLASFFDVCRLDMWMVPTLSYCNLFELSYVLLFAYLLSRNIKQEYKKSLKMVLYTYGLLLLLIIVCTSAGYVFMTE